MARRRVFRTRVECPGLHENIRSLLATGQTVALQKTAPRTINVVPDGKPAIGSLDETIAVQVASAIDRGQSFTATVEDAWGLAGQIQWLRLKVEYLLAPISILSSYG